MKKLCKCGKKIGYYESYCDSCIGDIEQEQKDYYRQYDRYSRDKESANFYNSGDWKRIRQHILSKYKGLDLYAYFMDDEIEYADTVHHIIELKDDWSKRLTIANLFPLTANNHMKIHKLYVKNKKETQKLLLNLLEKWKESYG